VRRTRKSAAKPCHDRRVVLIATAATLPEKDAKCTTTPLRYLTTSSG
jgi:hypothetical protein